MITKSLTFLLSLTFLFIFFSSSVAFADDFQDGMDAANREDSKEAVRWYRLSAEQGYPRSQLILGNMYSNGQGVPQDYKEAVRWYRLSAEQGLPQAQDSI